LIIKANFKPFLGGKSGLTLVIISDLYCSRICWSSCVPADVSELNLNLIRKYLIRRDIFAKAGVHLVCGLTGEHCRSAAKTISIICQSNTLIAVAISLTIVLEF
jgi:hypothetical protein